MAKQCDHILFLEADKNDADHLLPMEMRNYQNGVYLMKIGPSLTVEVNNVDCMYY